MTPPPETGSDGLRIAIASTGRFHVLDLARELQALGHAVQFLAHLSPKRAEAFGLPARTVTPLTRSAAPWLTWQRALPRLAPRLRKRLYFRALNRAVIRRMRPCDVFVCMSGVYVEAAEHARKRFGAKVFLERGSLHVDAQHAILEKGGALDASARLTRAREHAGYRLADRIVVPSLLAQQSFAGDAGLLEKTIVTPYGVDLDMFPPPATEARAPRQVLYVGNWTYQKGVDVLVSAIRQLQDVTLVHVGALGDVPFPQEPHFVHHAPLDQRDLAPFYQQAPVFALASRQDGFGLVLLQALACGCTCVASDHTGGPTVRSVWPEIAGRLAVVPAGDAEALAAAIRASLDAGTGGPLPDAVRQAFSWSGYGARYDRALREALAE